MKFTALLALLIGAFAQLSSASLVTASFEVRKLLHEKDMDKR